MCCPYLIVDILQFYVEELEKTDKIQCKRPNLTRCLYLAMTLHGSCEAVGPAGGVHHQLEPHGPFLLGSLLVTQEPLGAGSDK